MSTHIAFVRHGNHVNNVLTQEARADAIQLGKDLRNAGFLIEDCVSSPLGRTVETGLCIMQGNGEVKRMETNCDLGDISSDRKLPTDFMSRWKMLSQEKFGDTSDVNLAKTMFMFDEFHDQMLRRAKEGASVLRNLNVARPYATILVVLHAIARMEISLRELRGEKSVLNIPEDEIFGKGGCAIVEMDCGKVLNVWRVVKS